MPGDGGDLQTRTYDRSFLLGEKRNELLDLREVQRYGADAFGDPDFVSIYDLTPAEWYARGVRLLGRTAVECTRDLFADLIGRDLAAVTRRFASSALKVYDINPQAQNPGLLLGTVGWTAPSLS